MNEPIRAVLMELFRNLQGRGDKVLKALAWLVSWVCVMTMIYGIIGANPELQGIWQMVKFSGYILVGLALLRIFSAMASDLDE
jgi:uncharacterized membrane protein